MATKSSDSSDFLSTFREFPVQFRFALILAVLFMAFISWDQMHWWNTREDYMFGFLVPLFVAYVIWDRWPKIYTLVMGRVPPTPAPKEPAAAPEDKEEKANASSGEKPALSYQAQMAEELAKLKVTPGTNLPGAVDTTLRATAHVVILGAMALFFFGAFYRAGAGPSNPGSLFIALGFGFMLLPLFFLATPPGSLPTPPGAGVVRLVFADRRVRVAALFIFVAFIWIISAPLVSVIENNLSLFLLNIVTKVVFFTFEMGGFPLVREGNVLILPEGRVGVAEACSGIRSLTACLFAGSFMGAVFLNVFWKKVALVIAAAILAFITNIFRSLFLTAWAYNYGADSIGGTVHDVTGYAVLGVTCVGLICLLPLFNFSLSFDEEEGEAEAALPA